MERTREKMAGRNKRAVHFFAPFDKKKKQTFLFEKLQQFEKLLQFSAFAAFPAAKPPLPPHMPASLPGLSSPLPAPPSPCTPPVRNPSSPARGDLLFALSSFSCPFLVSCPSHNKGNGENIHNHPQNTGLQRPPNGREAPERAGQEAFWHSLHHAVASGDDDASRDDDAAAARGSCELRGWRRPWIPVPGYW